MPNNFLRAKRRICSSNTGEELFENVLSVSAEDIAFELRGFSEVEWADFLLNPRRLRGSDFLMRWSQGVWSEERLVEAVNATGEFVAYPYGPSGVAPEDNIRSFELYFARLEKAGLGQLKRPDLLIFMKTDAAEVERTIDVLGGLAELPFRPETDPRMKKLLARAILAVECENSLWRARAMPDYGAKLTLQARLGGKPGLKKTAIVPTVIVKREDMRLLRRWQIQRCVPLHIWHVFYDVAFGIAFDTAERLIKKGYIEPIEQTFQAPGGATTRKIIYKIYYQHAYHLGTAEEEPNLVADL